MKRAALTRYAEIAQRDISSTSQDRRRDPRLVVEQARGAVDRLENHAKRLADSTSFPATPTIHQRLLGETAQPTNPVR